MHGLQRGACITPSGSLHFRERQRRRIAGHPVQVEGACTKLVKGFKTESVNYQIQGRYNEPWSPHPTNHQASPSLCLPFRDSVCYPFVALNKRKEVQELNFSIIVNIPAVFPFDKMAIKFTGRKYLISKDSQLEIRVWAVIIHMVQGTPMKITPTLEDQLTSTLAFQIAETQVPTMKIRPWRTS